MFKIYLMLATISLSACGNPYASWPMRPAGYTSELSMFEERDTGCMYYIIKGRTDFKPMLRSDGTQIGCKKNV